MLRSLWLLFLFTAFLGLSVNAPFVATLGYVWVDTFQPQAVAYIILNQMPVAVIMAAAALGSYLLVDRRSPPRLGAETILQLCMAVWVTLTMTWAEAPASGWSKWDWAFKTLLFAAFVPYVIRSRVQIEAFVQTYVFSLAANFLPFGAKTLISGGGYGANLGLQQGNSGLSEGGLLSTVCLMAVPLAVYLSRYSQLIPRLKLMPVAYWGVAALAIVTAIGTYERSALVGLVVLVGYMWGRTKHKIGFTVVAALVGALVLYTTNSSWTARVATIGTFQSESSALVRLLVWKWTLGYASMHPFGGGFMSYLINRVDIPGANGEAGYTEFGRAFHSIYFELLGEQGYPGLAMFLTVAALTFFRLIRTARRARSYPELQWVVGLSNALQSGLAVFLTSGAFVGISFQPMFWYFVSLGISLNAYMWRVEHQEARPVTGWRAIAASANADRASPQTVSENWRDAPASTAIQAAAPRR